MTPRRPNTPKDAGPPRMPFASAEALLWGPEIKKQHAYLLTEMRALQKQHEDYNTRIQATEAIAEAAEAATARIRHLEQKLAAIEAEDEDKAFEKWASGELARLGVFVDANKSVRQKQIELDTELLRIAEDMDGLKPVTGDHEGVMRRLELLERGRKEDAEKIQRLVGEVERLGKEKEGGEGRNWKEWLGNEFKQSRVGLVPSPPRLVGNHSNLYSEPSRRTPTPPQTLAADTSDSMTELDDELRASSKLDPRLTRSELQVPRSPDVQNE